VTAQTLSTVSEIGREAFEDGIVIDSSIAPEMDEAQIDRMVRSGVTAFNWTVCRPAAALPEALSQIVEGLEIIDAHPDQLMLVRTTADIETAKRTGRVGLIFGPQNAKPVEGDLRFVRVLRDLGVRILQLTYNERNAFGDGCTEAAAGGLTSAGRELIAEVARQRLVLDLSHAGERTILEAIEASTGPVIISHANARAVFASPRNATDAVLDAIKACGGVIGLTLWSPMVAGGDRQPGIDEFVRHVSYVADRIGPEHIGLGSDHSEGYDRVAWETLFSHSGKYPSVAGLMGDWYSYDTRFIRGASSCVDLVNVAIAIGRLGFDLSELAGVLGGNFLRVFDRIWEPDQVESHA
jgi:membrane dipeptidase